MNMTSHRYQGEQQRVETHNSCRAASKPIDSERVPVNELLDRSLQPTINQPIIAVDTQEAISEGIRRAGDSQQADAVVGVASNSRPPA